MTGAAAGLRPTIKFWKVEIENFPWGVLFLIIFKLWYKRTPLTGKPRHERPPIPPQIEALGIDKVRDAMLEHGFAAVEELLERNNASLQKPATDNKYHRQLLKYVTDQQPGTRSHIHFFLQKAWWN